MRLGLRHLNCLWFALLLTSPMSASARTIDCCGDLSPETKFTVYIPNNISYKFRHPGILGFSPDGLSASSINAMKDACDRNSWILIASDTSKNGQAMEFGDSLNLDAVRTSIRVFPIDSKRIYVGGFSGGGMAAHWFIQKHPELVSGMISNCGMISRDIVRSNYPRNKAAVFLASPGDFRYREMHEDKNYLDSLGWKTEWIEFSGGHRWAPPETFSRGFAAIARLTPGSARPIANSGKIKSLKELDKPSAR